MFPQIYLVKKTKRLLSTIVQGIYSVCSSDGNIISILRANWLQMDYIAALDMSMPPQYSFPQISSELNLTRFHIQLENYKRNFYPSLIRLLFTHLLPFHLLSLIFTLSKFLQKFVLPLCDINFQLLSKQNKTYRVKPQSSWGCTIRKI